MGAVFFGKPYVRRLSWAGVFLIALFAMGWCDLRDERPEKAEVIQVLQTKGSLLAGAGKATLTPCAGVDKAGYPPFRPKAGGGETPLFARAIALRLGDTAIAIVSLDLLEVSEALSKAIDEKAHALGLDATLVTATHTHSSLGGYDRNLAVQVAALGRFEVTQYEEIVERALEALSLAVTRLEPAKARWSTRVLEGLNRNRAQKDGPIDQELRVLAFESLVTDAAIATLFSFDAHPTLVARRSERLDADFPGRTAERIETSTGAVALFFQGAAGDAGATPPEIDGISKADSMSLQLAEEVARSLELAKALPIDDAALARVRISLPLAQAPATVPWIFQRPASKLLQSILMDHAYLTLLRLGPLNFLAMPGEPTFFVGQHLKQTFDEPGYGPMIFMSLAHGYVGYMESEERRRLGLGESRRALWEPELEVRLITGVEFLFTALKSEDSAN